MPLKLVLLKIWQCPSPPFPLPSLELAQSLTGDYSQDIGQGFRHLKVSLGLEDLDDLVGFTQGE